VLITTVDGVLDPPGPIGAVASRVIGTVAAQVGRGARDLPFEVHTPSWPSYQVGVRANDAFLARRFPEAAARFREAYALDTTVVSYALWEAVAWSNTGNDERIAASLDELAPRRDELTRFDWSQFSRHKNQMTILDGDGPQEAASVAAPAERTEPLALFNAADDESVAPADGQDIGAPSVPGLLWD